MGLAMFVLLPLDALSLLIGVTGIVLALLLWREWPLLVMAATWVLSRLVLSPPVVFSDQIPLPPVCTDHWGSGLCYSVVFLVSGLVLLFFSLRYFLFPEASAAEKRILLIGMATSALWAALVAAVNYKQIRDSVAVVVDPATGPQLMEASRQLRKLVGLVALLPIGWMAFATIRALAHRVNEVARQHHRRSD